VGYETIKGHLFGQFKNQLSSIPRVIQVADEDSVFDPAKKYVAANAQTTELVAADNLQEAVSSKESFALYIPFGADLSEFTPFIKSTARTFKY
jgi:hypothetical protein